MSEATVAMDIALGTLLEAGKKLSAEGAAMRMIAEYAMAAMSIEHHELMVRWLSHAEGTSCEVSAYHSNEWAAYTGYSFLDAVREVRRRIEQGDEAAEDEAAEDEALSSIVAERQRERRAELLSGEDT